MGFNCLKATATSGRQFTFYHSVLKNSWYSCYRPRKDERLTRPWSHPVVLNKGPLDWKSSALTTRPLLGLISVSNHEYSYSLSFHKVKLRRCLHETSVRVKWNIFNLVYGSSLVTVSMKYSEMKLIASVISLQSLWQKWKFISSDKMLRKHYPEMKSYKIKHLCMQI